METTKITEAITNGFYNLMEKLGLKDKANDENVKNAFSEFSTSIANAITENKEGQEGLGEDKVKEIVNEAIKKIGENEDFKSAVANSLKEVPQNVKDAIKEATKNTVTKEDFSNGMKELTKAVTDKLGKGTSGEERKNEKKRVVKNRFADAYEEYYEN